MKRNGREVWAKAFKALHSRLGKDWSRIDSLLDWYERNVNSIDRPTVLDAKQFVDQFGWLEDLYRKNVRQRREAEEVIN